jgi:hypothetical protein
MSFKKLLTASLLFLSVGAFAIPPLPPSIIINKIKTIVARNCKTIGEEILVSDLIDTSTVKFVLELNNEGNAGILKVVENGKIADNLEVVCQ